MNRGGFFIIGIDADIADMGIGQGDDLPGVGRVGQYFLVAGHGGIEYHLAAHLAVNTNSNTAEYTSVCKRQQGRFSQLNLPF